MKILRRVGLAALLSFVLAAAYLITLQVRGNFHPIVEGEAYRSAQPSADDLTKWVAEKGIRSVINLRGAQPGTPWYDAEVAAAKALGLNHYNFGMSAGKRLSPEDTTKLLALLRDAPKPVLIHCKSGADRTGLAAALYLAQKGQPEKLAEAQISFRYGHISLPISAAWPMDQTWEALEASFGYES